MRIKSIKRKEEFTKPVLPENILNIQKEIKDIKKFLNPKEDGLFLGNGEMKSPNYVDGKRGWKLDSKGNIKVVDLTATGNIRGTMDRSDFHWLTLFESIDGFYKNGTNSYLFTLDPSYVEIRTGNAYSDKVYFKKQRESSLLVWTKKRRLKIVVKFLNNTSQNWYLVTGSVNEGAFNTPAFGFKIVNGTIYGYTEYNNSYSQTTLVSSLSTAAVYELEAYFVPGESVSFLVNNAPAGDILVDNLPQGDVADEQLMDVYGVTLTTDYRKIDLYSWDLWQAY